jgi:hypothetical protein
MLVLSLTLGLGFIITNNTLYFGHIVHIIDSHKKNYIPKKAHFENILKKDNVFEENFTYIKQFFISDLK